MFVDRVESDLLLHFLQILVQFFVAPGFGIHTTQQLLSSFIHFYLLLALVLEVHLHRVSVAMDGRQTDLLVLQNGPLELVSASQPCRLLLVPLSLVFVQIFISKFDGAMVIDLQVAGAVARRLDVVDEVEVVEVALVHLLSVLHLFEVVHGRALLALALADDPEIGKTVISL